MYTLDGMCELDDDAKDDEEDADDDDNDDDDNVDGKCVLSSDSSAALLAFVVGECCLAIVIAGGSENPHAIEVVGIVTNATVISVFVRFCYDKCKRIYASAEINAAAPQMEKVCATVVDNYR